MIGTGILAMPVCFRNGGLWMSLIFVLLVGALCTHCMHLLVRAEEELCRETGANHLAYSGVMEMALEVHGGRLRTYSVVGRTLVDVFLVFTQFGFCCIYIVFIAQNIQQVVDYLCPHSLSEVTYIVMVSAALVPYAMVKSLKTLVPFSALANIINTAGLVIVFSDLFQDVPSSGIRPAFGGVANLPLFFGQAIFAFEGIGMILPLHDKLQDRSAFLGKFGILNLGLTIAVCANAAMGFYGYLKYGEHTKGSITLNLPSDNWLYLSVKMMFAVSIFLTFAIQFYVPINIVLPYIEEKMALQKKHGPQSWWQYLFRFLCICIACGLSALVPHLDLLTSLIGALASSFLALQAPAVIDMVVFPASVYRYIKDISIILVGVMGSLVGTYTSLLAIAETF